MKSLSSKTYQCGVTIQGLTTLSGTVYLTGITNTASWDHVIVGTTAQGQIYTRTYAQFMGDVATGISLSSYVTGSGTTNYLPKFTGASALGNSQIFDNGTNVGIGTASPSSILDTVVSSGGTSGLRFRGYSDASTPYLLSLGTYSYPDQFQIKSVNGLVTMGIVGATGANPDLAFQTNTTERMRITTAGNVGIGTTSPSQKLDVQGDISVGVSGATTVHTYYNSTTRNQIVYTNNSSFEFHEGANERVRIAAGGNVGIGTTAPLQKLHVVTTATAGLSDLTNIDRTSTNLIRFTNPQYSTVASMGILLRVFPDSDTRQGAGIIASGGTNNSETNLSLFVSKDVPTSLSNSYAALTILGNNGNVGIGITSPSYKTEVSASIGNYWNGTAFTGTPLALAITNTTAGGYDSVLILQQTDSGGTSKNSGAIGMVGTGPWTAGNNGSQVSDMYFLVRNGSGGVSERMRITSGGSLLIGSTTQAYNPQTQGYLFGVKSNVTQTFISIAKSGQTLDSGGMIVGLDATTGYVWMRESTDLTFGTNNTTRVTIAAGGNVGIGTSSPISKLHVADTGESVITIQDLDGTNQFLNIGHNGGSSYFLSRDNISNGNFSWYTYDGTTLSTRMHIAPGGNVGIGSSNTDPLSLGRERNLAIVTTGTNATLTLVGGGAGRIDFGVNTTRTAGIYSDATNYTEIFTSTALPLVFSTNSTEKMRITSGGNVGIGTSSPVYKLDVNGIGNFSNGFSNPSSETGYRLKFYDNGGTYNDTGIGLDGAGAGGEIMWFNALGGFYWGLGTGGTKMKLDSSGNLGIGTTSPSTLLDVSGVITATGGNSTNWNTAYGWGNHASASYVPQARTLTINGTSYDLSANRTWTISTTTAAGSDTQVQYNSSGSLAGASALTYNSTTNRVGINQASPGYDLDVNGQVRVQDKLRVGTGNGVVHMSSTATINASATTVVWAQTVSVGMCAFIEYYILNSNSLTDQRAGTIIVTWNQSGTPTITHTETTTPDIGSTTTVNFTSSLVGSDARINAVNSSANPYTMVMSYKYF